MSDFEVLLKGFKASYRGIAQLVEYRSPKPWVAGSNPPAPAKAKRSPSGDLFCFGTRLRVRENAFKLPAILGFPLSWRSLMPSLLGGVLNPPAPAKKKAIRVSGWFFSVKSADGGRNPPAVDEIASR